MSLKMLKIAYVLIIFIIIFVLFYSYVLANPDNPVKNPGTDIKICTELISDCCAESSRPRLEWSIISESGQSYQIAYWVQIDDNSDFSSPVVNTGGITSYATFYIPPNDSLDDNILYYWKVGVKDNFDSWTGWTGSESFQLPIIGCGCSDGYPDTDSYPGSDFQVCTVPVGENSCCSGSTLTPTLRWNVISVSGDSFQTAYWIKVDDNSDFSSPIIDTGQVISTVLSYTTAEEIFDSYTTYYWKVGARDNFNSWTDWITGESFQGSIGCEYNPGTPPNIFPTDFPWSEFQICTDSVTQPECYNGYFPTPTLNWTFFSSNGESSQIAYWVQIDNDSDFLSPEFDSGEISSSANSHQICVDSLEFSSSYYWRLAAKDSKGTWLDWTSPGEIFVVAPSCAPNMPIIGDVSKLTNLCYGIKVEWVDNSDNELGFNVQVKSDTYDWQDFCNVNPNIINCSAILGPNTTYYFRVKSLGEYIDSNWSPGGLGVDYNTSYCTPSLNLGQYNCDEVNLTWSQVGSGVDYYEIWRKTNNEDWLLIAGNISNTQFNYTDNDILSGVSYQYRIKAEDQDLDSNIEVVQPCPDLPLWKEVRVRNREN